MWWAEEEKTEQAGGRVRGREENEKGGQMGGKERERRHTLSPPATLPTCAAGGERTGNDVCFFSPQLLCTQPSTVTQATSALYLSSPSPQYT